MDLREGGSVGPYRVVELAGAGGMGEVWRARDDRLARDVALKVLHASMEDGEARRRLIAEARAVSALNHPHIVVVHDLLSVEDRDVLVMEFVAGDVLSHRIPAGGLKLREALKLGIGIADALAAAHAAGVVHRDIKPANVLITRSGSPKVLDFGLARRPPRTTPGDATVAETAASIAGLISGTPAYMSPEQAVGRAADHRSDIFSFGALLYEVLTGRRAFERRSVPETLTAVIQDEPDIPESWPAPLARAVRRCLRKDPERRFQSMADVRLELAELLEEVEHPPPGARTREVSAGRWKALALLSLLLLAVPLAASSWWLLQERSGEPEWQMLPLSALPGLEQQPALSRTGDQVAFMWDGGDVKNHDVYVQHVSAATPPLRLTTDPAEDSSPCWSPDGRQVAFLRRRPDATDVMVVSALGGAERRLAEIARQDFVIGMLPPTGIDWSPDGRFIALGTATLSLLEVATGEVIPFAPAPGPGTDRDPAFSPDGRAIVYSRGPNPVLRQLWVQRIDGEGRPAGTPEVLGPEFRNYMGAAWLDNRSVIAAAGWAGSNTRLFRVGRNGSLRPIPIESVAVWNPSYQPAHRRLVYQRRIITTDVVQVALGGTPAADVRPLISSTYQDREAKYSPDGTKLVFISTRSGQPAVWRSNSDGTNQVLIGTVDQSNAGSPRWTADGRHIVFDASTLEAGYDIFAVSADGGTPRRLTSGPSQEMQPAASRDGRWVYFTTDGGIWKVPFEGGDPVQVVTDASQPLESLDGRTLYFLRRGELWRVSTGGGTEELFASNVQPNSWTLGKDDLYVLRIDPGMPSRFVALDLQTGVERTMFELPADMRFYASSLVDVAPDGSAALVSPVTRDESDLVVVDRFP